MNFLGVKTVTGGEWNESTVNGVLTNEKYKGDYHLQKYFTPENKRNQSRLSRGEVQSYYITDNHPAIESEEKWNQVHADRERRKKNRKISADGTEK